MNSFYVLKSKNLQVWSHSIGITKYTFKFGLAKNNIKDHIKDLNSKVYAGRDDWVLILSKSTVLDSEDEVINKLSESIEMLDPDLYPQIRNSKGIFKVKKNKVENSVMIRKAFEDNDKLTTSYKVSDKDFAQFILSKATI